MIRRAKEATKAKAAPRRMAKRPPNDKSLINHCVTYAQSVAAHREGFRADPDGNTEHAAALGSRHRSRAFQSLTWIASTSAKTPDGLCAKARVVAVLMEKNEDGCFDIADRDFLKSFGDEVKAFLQPICDGHVMLEADTPDRREYREREERIRVILNGGAS